MGTYLFYRVFTGAIGLLPIGLAVRLGRLLGWLGYWLAPGYRSLAVRNLGIAFPELSAAEKRRLARRHFTSLGGNLFASEKLARISKERIQQLVKVEGFEHVERLVAARRGFVFIISHTGNWELLAQAAPILFPCPSGTVYQRLSNPRIDAHIRRTRGRNGLALFERKAGFNQAVEMLRAGGCVGVLADQHAGDSGVWCPFFGKLASTSPMPAMLARRARAAVVPIAMNTDGVGRWKMVIDAPIEGLSKDAGEATAQINQALEQQIRRVPSDWFWVHNRWKTPRPNFLLSGYKRGVAFPPLAKTRAAPGDELFAYAEEKAQKDALQPFRIVVRSSNWLGDAVITVPAVRAIKHGRPDAHVSVLTPAKLADLWQLLPEVDEVIPFDPPKRGGLLGKFRSMFAVFRVAGLLRGRSFDAAIIFPNSIRTAAEAWLAGIPRRVGFPGHPPRTIFLNQILRDKKRKKNTPAPPPVHQVNHYLRIAQFVGADLADGLDPARPVGPRLPAAPAAPLERLRLAVCPGAEYGPAKRYLPERFAEAMRQVDEKYHCDWLLVGTERDRPVAEEIVGFAKLPNMENLCGRTTLTELIGMLRRCHLLVTNDTGTMHLATLLGVKTVAIFGSTEPALTGPLGPGHVVLRKQVECSPCFLRECPLDFRCMKSVEVAEVVAAVDGILEQGVPAV